MISGEDRGVVSYVVPSKKDRKERKMDLYCFRVGMVEFMIDYLCNGFSFGLHFFRVCLTSMYNFCCTNMLSDDDVLGLRT